jgi:hypothetical protein
MQQFQAFLSAMFASLITFSKGSNRTLAKVIDLLIQFKNRVTGVETGLATTNQTVSTLQGSVSTLQTDVARLGQVKGNYEALPYNYSKDGSATKPQSGVSAMDLFTYVTTLLGIVPVNGKSYQIQFAGTQSIPTTVNGDVESGDPNEALMVIVSDAGQYNFVYQSDETNEKLGYIASKADETNTLFGAEQTEQTRLEGILTLMLTPAA